MPTPLMVNVEEGAGDRERARARVEHDAVDLRSLRDDGRVQLEVANVAVSAGPLGTVPWQPSWCAVPVSIGRTCLPGGAPGKAAACCRKQERQNGGGRGKEGPRNGAQR